MIRFGVYFAATHGLTQQAEQLMNHDCAPK